MPFLCAVMIVVVVEKRCVILSHNDHLYTFKWIVIYGSLLSTSMFAFMEVPMVRSIDLIWNFFLYVNYFLNFLYTKENYQVIVQFHQQLNLIAFHYYYLYAGAAINIMHQQQKKYKIYESTGRILSFLLLCILEVV